MSKSVRNPLGEMGRWLKEQGIVQRERTDAEMIALALFELLSKMVEAGRMGCHEGHGTH